MKQLILFISVSFLLNALQAQKLTITGTIKNQAGQPVEHATLFTTLNGADLVAKTDSNGNYKVICWNGDTLICKHINYVTVTEKIEGNDIIHFTLSKNAFRKFDVNVANNYASGKPAIKGSFTPKSERQEFEEAHPLEIVDYFRFVGIAPNYSKGKDSLERYLNEYVFRPGSSAKATMAGVIKVEADVSKKGCITHVRLIKGIDRTVDSSFINALLSMPCKWIPAVQDGRNIDSFVEISIMVNGKEIQNEHD